MAEWLCSGLQLRVRRFDSDPSLHFPRLCPGGGIGRRCGLKIRFPKGSAGSSPAPGTNQATYSVSVIVRSCFAPPRCYDDRLMVSFTRQSCITVLLILLVGHAALTLHVSTHVSIGQASCDYCEAYSSPSHAVAPAADGFRLAVALRFELPAVLPLIGTTDLHSYRQRAPPSNA